MMDSKAWATVARYNAVKARAEETARQDRTAEHEEVSRQLHAARRNGDSHRSGFWVKVQADMRYGRDMREAMAKANRSQEYYLDRAHADHMGHFNYWRAV